MQPTDNVTDVFRLQEPQKRALRKLGIGTTSDLLRHFPTRYERGGEHMSVAGIVRGNDTTLYGVIREPEARVAWKTRRPMSEAWLEDATGRVKLMWFNQPYMARMLPDGIYVQARGRVEGTRSLYVANPEITRVDALPPYQGAGAMYGATEETGLCAVYPETVGITSRWFRHAISKVLDAKVHEQCPDPIPLEVRTRYHLPSLATALMHIHTPTNERVYLAARKRFAFEEVFILQVARQQTRRRYDALPTLTIPDGRTRVTPFVERLPFSLTRGQYAAINHILTDMARSRAMSRLLEGDVGSGKTAVAAATAYAVVTSAPIGRPSGTLQVAYMAPTEVLAEQHFTSFIALFKHLPIQIGLVTGTVCKKFPSKVDPTAATNISKTQLLSWVANGEIAILLGTHALIEKRVTFRDLAYVVIDEQHRFGTRQRMALARKDGLMPHLLSMTATPIPRTLALALFGDLDLTVLDDMPPGRKPVVTTVVHAAGRTAMYEALRRELDSGRQAYVICPRIDEPDPRKELAVQTRSVLAEATRLRATDLKGYRIDVLHGQMKPMEKDAAMRAFLAHDCDVLVATSVVEVGVNVPNATVIIIEGAERFGLAQLHQLRGRVVRSTHQAYCYALTSEGGTNTRLRAFTRAKNGFELAELDLKIRGPGELYGREQSGMSDVGMEALRNIRLVEAARTEAQRIVQEDPHLAEHRALAEAAISRSHKIHIE